MERIAGSIGDIHKQGRFIIIGNGYRLTRIFEKDQVIMVQTRDNPFPTDLDLRVLEMSMSAVLKWINRACKYGKFYIDGRTLGDVDKLGITLDDRFVMVIPVKTKTKRKTIKHTVKVV